MSIVEVVRKSVTTVEVAHPGVQGPPGSGGGGGGAVDSVNGRTGAVTLTKADVGLSNADNTSDANKPVSTAQAAADTVVANAAAAALAGHVAAADPHPAYALESSLATVATSGAYGDLTGKPTLGTAAPLNVAASGDAASGEVVKGNDSRLTDARAPTAHTHPATDISDSTAAGRAVLTAADAAAQRTALGVPAGSGSSTGTNTGDQTSVAGNAGTATALQTSRNIDGVAFNGTADITVIAPATVAATSKATPVDADVLPIADSAASNVLKKLTWANLKATLKTYFDTLYQPLAANLTAWAALATSAKQDTLVSGTNIKTINSTSLLGSGNVSISGLTNFTEGVDSSSPNATVPVVTLTATNAATNVDAAIIIKGTGALLAQIPDSSTTGGNKRGTNAVDLQMSRGAAAQVVSGNYSFASGRYNTVSGAESAAVGASHTVSGQYSFAAGNASSATNSYCYAFGFSAVSSGVGAFACGSSVTSNAHFSVGFGQGVTARGYQGSFQSAMNQRSSVGDRQFRRLPLALVTTNATTTTMTADAAAEGTSNTWVIPNNYTGLFEGWVVARNTSNNDSIGWKFQGMVSRDASAATIALLGSVTPTAVGTADASMSSCALAVTVNTTNGSLIVQATGIAATTIHWVGGITPAFENG